MTIYVTSSWDYDQPVVDIVTVAHANQQIMQPYIDAGHASPDLYVDNEKNPPDMPTPNTGIHIKTRQFFDLTQAQNACAAINAQRANDPIAQSVLSVIVAHDDSEWTPT